MVCLCCVNTDGPDGEFDYKRLLIHFMTSSCVFRMFVVNYVDYSGFVFLKSPTKIFVRNQINYKININVLSFSVYIINSPEIRPDNVCT